MPYWHKTFTYILYRHFNVLLLQGKQQFRGLSILRRGVKGGTLHIATQSFHIDMLIPGMIYDMQGCGF